MRLLYPRYDLSLASRALLFENTHPSRKEIREGLSGNLCRCTGYEAIFRAVEKAAKLGYGDNLKKEPDDMTNVSLPFLSAEEKEWVFIPQSVEEALAVLKDYPDVTIRSGMTDIGPDIKNRKTYPQKILDISHIDELHRITYKKELQKIFIGSACTNRTLMTHPFIRQHFPSLSHAASLCGAIAIQNRATIGGNLMTASGAADLPVILMALGGSVVLCNKEGSRTVPLEILLWLSTND